MNSVEDSIAEEQSEGYDKKMKIATLKKPSPTLQSKYSYNYYSDENGSGKLVPTIEMSLKKPEYIPNTVISTTSKFCPLYSNTANSYENVPSILVNDPDQLDVIKERQPRKTKPMNQTKKKSGKHYAFSNYRKRAVEVEKQK